MVFDMSDAPKSQKQYSANTSPFLDEIRIVLRLKHMSRRTEASYIFYILDYLGFHGQAPTQRNGNPGDTNCLANLATKGKAAVSAQKCRFDGPALCRN
jgi:hypothetical protein